MTATEWLDVLAGPETRIASCGRKVSTTPWHRHFTPPEELLYFVAENSAQGTVADESVELNAGDLFWASAGTPFALRLVDPKRPITFYHLRFHTGQASGRPFAVGRDVWQVTDALDQLLDEYRFPTALRGYRVRGCLTLIFFHLFNAHMTDPKKDGAFGESQRQILYAFIEGKWHLRLTPSDLAAQLELSPDYFTRVFRRTFGIAPRQWLKRERIRHAASALRESNARTSEIAREFGYANPFLFSRQFREVMGCSARQYRQRHRRVFDADLENVQ